MRMVRPGRWPRARSQCREHASQAGREGSEGRRGKRDKVDADWLIPVAGARSLRLLSALLQPRSGRRLRAPSGPIRSQPAPAGEAAIGRSPVTKRDKGRRGKEKKRGKKKKKKESANGGYWQAGSARGLKLPGDRRGSRWGSVGPDARREGEAGRARSPLPGTGCGGGERTERGAGCHLAGRALFWSLGGPRAESLPTDLFTVLGQPSPPPW